MRQTVAVGVIKAVEKTDGKAGKVTKAAEKGTLLLSLFLPCQVGNHVARRRRLSDFRRRTSSLSPSTFPPRIPLLTLLFPSTAGKKK
jgi:hypothetical protein